MAGFGGNPYMNNRHADVLNENPTSDDAKIRLVEEVKNRAKGAFQQKDMPSAELLYGKAIELLETMPDKKEAALYSNRSMCRLNLGKVEDALKDANSCLAVDQRFAKGWYRKAQALLRLSEWDDAITAAEAGKAVEPDNKAFAELIDKANADKAKDLEDKAKLRTDAQDVRVELHNASTSRAAQKPKEKKDDDPDADLSMRGYKKTSDGKTTSFFHTEISDEAKKLIEAQGFGKPQKIEGTAADPTETKGGGSAWNSGGSYEEKNMMKFVEERIKTGLSGITFDVPTSTGGTISATRVTDIKGDANISVSRGKRRHLLDVSFTVEYEAKVGEKTGKGKLNYSEVNTNADDEAEVSMEVDRTSTPAELTEVLNSFVKSGGQGLQPLLTAEIKKFIEEYKAK
eukprot:gnl/TRDRNA2_/TRDRNA2_193795_c0_seq1.p1 gnl/TRDRNA2_/TRDRNA2_193795_c0~~gnl/TRDRNA2_/TRDRNA2_193795_c0_seq1.p1  ORF type:complete len:422 (-),score=103.37 gnl/TRDRNA2_/TRDRNA2_193795_c0_seq1:45-1244(-)